MEYFICHGLWLKPYVFNAHLGFCNARCFGKGLRVGMNYTIWFWNGVNEGQGGDINAPWKSWPPNLGLGILYWFDHLQQGCVSSSFKQYGGVKLRWISRYIHILV